MRIGTSAKFCSDHNLLFPTFDELTNQPLTPTIAIDIGGIDEVATEVNELVESRFGVVIGNGSPSPPDRPGTKTDFRNVPASTAKRSVVHSVILAVHQVVTPR